MSTSKYNPAYDNKIYEKYSKKTIQNKLKNKSAFCEEYELTFDKRIPLIAVPIALTPENNIELIEKIIPGLIEQPIELAFTGIGTKEYQEFFSKLTDQYPNKCMIISSDDTEMRRLLAAADMALIPCMNDEGVEAANAAQSYGTVPITAGDHVKDYDPIEESGNSFLFNGKSSWSLFATMVRAFETFRFPYDWKGIQVNAMENVE